MRPAGICFMRLTLLSCCPLLLTCCSVFDGTQQEGKCHVMWPGWGLGTFSEMRLIASVHRPPVNSHGDRYNRASRAGTFVLH